MKMCLFAYVCACVYEFYTLYICILLSLSSVFYVTFFFGGVVGYYQFFILIVYKLLQMHPS